jgi:hypothetical protein
MSYRVGPSSGGFVFRRVKMEFLQHLLSVGRTVGVIKEGYPTRQWWVDGDGGDGGGDNDKGAVEVEEEEGVGGG